MSISYTLEIGGQRQYSELAERLCRVPEYQQTAAGIIAPGLKVFIGQPRRLGIEMIEEEFEFTPTAHVSFRWDKETDIVEVHTRLLQECRALLEGNTDDAVLLLNGEVVILLRRNGRLVLNRVEGFWADEDLAVIPSPIVTQRKIRSRSKIFQAKSRSTTSTPVIARQISSSTAVRLSSDTISKAIN
jgi:hypothetical protein